MCTNQKWIPNKYTGQRFFVKCGHCEACLQEKAMMRATKIKANYNGKDMVLFVTLTYDRLSCPYVDFDEAYKFSKNKLSELSVYRSYSVRKVRRVTSSSPYGLCYKRVWTPVVLATIPFDSVCSFKGNRCLAKFGNRIGISFYPDYQHFCARLRINLKRKFNFNGKLQVYNVSEYGESTLRPHFHLLVYSSGIDYTSLRNAIVESWPFSNLDKRNRSIELAENPASYIASYVNRGSSFPSFLEKYFKPKWSYSKGFGLAKVEFSASNVYEAYRKGALQYDYAINRGNFLEVFTSPIPKYVIHRFFPLFKGYSRIDVTSLPSYFTRNLDIRRIKGEFQITSEDLYKTQIRLENARLRWNEESGQSLSMNDYALLHTSVWRLYKSTCLRLFMERDDIPITEKYDNLLEAKTKHLFPVGLDWNDVYELNANRFQSVVNKSTDSVRLYHKMCKDRKFKNHILALNDEEF